MKLYTRGDVVHWMNKYEDARITIMRMNEYIQRQQLVIDAYRDYVSGKIEPVEKTFDVPHADVWSNIIEDTWLNKTAQ